MHLSRMNKTWFIMGLIVTLQCAHLKEAQLQHEQGQYKQSIELCKAAISADSTDARAYLLLSKNYLALDSLAQATRSAEQALKWNSESQFNRQHLARCYVASARMAVKQENFRQAYTCFENARKTAPQDSVVIQSVATYYFDRGQLDKSKNEWEALRPLVTDTTQIVQMLNKISERTSVADAALKKGVAAMKKTHYITAQTELEKALKAKPDHVEAKYQLHMAQGHAYFKKGSKSALWEAIEAYGLAMALKDTEAEPHFWLGKAYEKKDDREFTNAIDEYKMVLELDPQGPYSNEAKAKVQKLTKLKTKLDKFWGRN